MEEGRNSSAGRVHRTRAAALTAGTPLRTEQPMKKRSAPTYRNKSEQIADALMSRIIDAGLKPGDMLGTEAELLAEHEVSRPTLRETLRMLEAQGVIALRPGPGG